MRPILRGVQDCVENELWHCIFPGIGSVDHQFFTLKFSSHRTHSSVLLYWEDELYECSKPVKSPSVICYLTHPLKLNIKRNN